MGTQLGTQLGTQRYARVMWAVLVGLVVAALAPLAWAQGAQWARGPSPGPRGPQTRVPAVATTWPVGVRPRILRGWSPPASPYGPGHRGVDLAAGPGAPVRTVAAGRVSFAGRVADKGVVSVELAGTGTPPLRTTYEPVRPSVKRGDEVPAGAVIATVEPTGSHCTLTCVHWGLRGAGTYLNPLLLLPPRLRNGGSSRLLPVLGVPLPS